MHVVDSRHQFSVQHQQLQYQLELKNPPTQPTSVPFGQSSAPGLARATQQAGHAVGHALSKTTPPPESTSESAENEEDTKQFSALHSIGEVKKILEQLITDHAIAWQPTLSFNENPPPTPPIASAAPNESQDVVTASVTSGPSSTLTFRYQQLTAELTGAATLADGKTFEWSMSFSQTEWSLQYQQNIPAATEDPLLISFDGSFRFSGQTQAFDLHNSGQADGQIAMLQGEQYYLVWDHNQNGKADAGNELFGPSTGHGFFELAKLDHDGNGFIDAADTAFTQLFLWRPGDALKSLQDLKVGALSTTSVDTPFDYYQQHQLMARLQRSGVMLTDEGQTGLVQQVDFSV